MSERERERQRETERDRERERQRQRQTETETERDTETERERVQVLYRRNSHKTNIFLQHHLFRHITSTTPFPLTERLQKDKEAEAHSISPSC